ncbi:hypothetical protein SLEP1_g2695 [Rubroshorea leprosula]|uniref:Uncharacterized protein n=1 Tax=Rubroshorea leprosula TaxID=152421 RepID=A0AAV5HRP9_9ROSI|nr:hypothetical protein SLEP1_g2695 [Rubroshorea leprosula]
MSGLQLGASFVVGTFFGGFMARGFQRRCDRHRKLKEAGGHDGKPCPLSANEKKTGDSNPAGPHVEEKIPEKLSKVA